MNKERIFGNKTYLLQTGYDCRARRTDPRRDDGREKFTALGRGNGSAQAETRERDAREHDNEFSLPDDEIAVKINYNDFGDSV